MADNRWSIRPCYLPAACVHGHSESLKQVRVFMAHDLNQLSELIAIHPLPLPPPHLRWGGHSDLQRSAQRLLSLDAFEQGFEVPLSEARRALAVDDFVE